METTEAEQAANPSVIPLLHAMGAKGATYSTINYEFEVETRRPSSPAPADSSQDIERVLTALFRRRQWYCNSPHLLPSAPCLYISEKKTCSMNGLTWLTGFPVSTSTREKSPKGSIEAPRRKRFWRLSTLFFAAIHVVPETEHFRPNLFLENLICGKKLRCVESEDQRPSRKHAPPSPRHRTPVQDHHGGSDGP